MKRARIERSSRLIRGANDGEDGRSQPEVFIIESLQFTDEKRGYSEGAILRNTLLMMDKRPEYYYLRTLKELKVMARDFERSRYRYLHISCHGDGEGFSLTLDRVPFKDFAAIFGPVVTNRRIFLSACGVAQPELADELFKSPKAGPYSITGPSEAIDFADAAAVWASLYSLLFKHDTRKIKGQHIRQHLGKLCELNDVSFVHFGRTSISPYFETSNL